VERADARHRAQDPAVRRGEIDAPLPAHRVVEAQCQELDHPAAPPARYSARLARPPQTRLTTVMPSMSTQSCAPHRGCIRREEWVCQVPKSKSKSWLPSWPATGAAARHSDAGRTSAAAGPARLTAAAW